MANFIFPNEGFVLIHIPKCGGWSIREGLFRHSLKIGPLFDTIPNEYKNLPKLAIVRNPYTRFVSAYKMLKYGTGDFAGSFDGDIIDFMKKIKENDDINIFHHAIPQTHPHNCLHLASHVCYFENYDDDVGGFFTETIGLKNICLTKLNVSRNKRDTFIPEKVVKEINVYYSDDFSRLNYRKFSREITVRPDGEIFSQGLTTPDR